MKTRHRLLFFLIIFLLILGVAAIGVGRPLYEKYSYGTEREDLDAFFGVTENELAVILGNETLEEKALLGDGDVCYFSYDMVRAYLTDGFYYAADYQGGTLLFTTAAETYEQVIGTGAYSIAGAATDVGYPLSLLRDGRVYLAADYVRMFAAFSYQVYDRHVQVKTEWGSRTMMEITKDTQIRVRGGIKSPILREVEAGEQVELIEEMEEWSKVKTSDAIIGYIENKRMSPAGAMTEVAPDAPELPEYTFLSVDGRVSLGFHAIYGAGGNDDLGSRTAAELAAVNVIAPTWFSLSDNEGGYRSYASADYVNRAHAKGLQVWGVLDDFNDPEASISDLEIFSDTAARRSLISQIVAEALSVGMDGINLDLEMVSDDAFPHYLQFLKEISVQCHKQGLILSTCVSPPLNSGNARRFDIQGRVCDYVLMMGYDERGGGSKNPGSVASIGFVTNGMDWILEQLPPEKLINALPFYTREWKTEGGTVTNRALALNSDSENLAYARQIAVWKEDVGQNYAEWTAGGATYQIWLEDTESLLLKVNAMSARDLGGVAVWRLGYGTDAAWSVVQLYAEN